MYEEKAKQAYGDEELSTFKRDSFSKQTFEYSYYVLYSTGCDWANQKTGFHRGENEFKLICETILPDLMYKLGFSECLYVLVCV